MPSLTCQDKRDLSCLRDEEGKKKELTAKQKNYASLFQFILYLYRENSYYESF